MSSIADFRELIERHAEPSIEGQQTAIPGVSLMRLVTPARPVRQTQDLIFYMVVGGRKLLTIGDQRTMLTAGDYIVSNADLDIVSEIADASPADPYLGVAIRLDPILAMSTARSLGLERPKESTQLYIGGSGNDNGLVDATARLLALLDQKDDIPSLAPLLEQELVYRLLKSEVGPSFVEFIWVKNRQMRINRIIESIARDYSEPLDIAAMARTNGFSMSSLYRHFKEATRMSPIQFQKKIRLRQARQMMLADRENVVGASFRVGFASPTQFSREYKRTYGLSPARDVARLRKDSDSRHGRS
jgi:AraC-like DNA-binding protein